MLLLRSFITHHPVTHALTLYRVWHDPVTGLKTMTQHPIL